jgi:hypothetical protein
MHIWLQRALRWEFWPWRLVYIPVAVYWFFLAIKAKGWVFFSAANPAMRFGGLVAYSKSGVNQLIPDQYIPKTIYVNAEKDNVPQKIQEAELIFPLILKPDVGERGRGVEIVRTKELLSAALQKRSGDFLVQEYADLPMELGVMYSRHPDEESGKITSVVIKEFPKVTGNGTSTLQELILGDLRARLSFNVHEIRFANKLQSVPEKGEEVQLVHIGNHRLGTIFYNGEHLIDEELEQVFENVAKQIPGFFVGRFDLRTVSIAELKKGNFVILEVNGVNSEPCHIFHPDRSLFLAWRDLFKHWKRIAEISIANHKRGVPYASYSEIRAEIKRHNLALRSND